MFCRAPLRFPPALITIRAGPDGRTLPLISRESPERKFSPHLIAPIAKGKVGSMGGIKSNVIANLNKSN